MSETATKNIPQPTPETASYWEACRRHELTIQYCSACGRYQFYPRIVCTNCMSDKLEWVQAAGRGQVVSYTLVHRAVSQAYADEVPYVIALIQLQEGPQMMSTVVQCDPGSVKIGMAVEVVFDDWSEHVTVPKFRPLSR